ncbi:hypothetical protein RRSWK_06570 [Rhodopirellula sp. SWK7]|nr:hypothetical protein RRSWK_06570 [Rhodopirellula sp. SWK7]
MFCGVLVTDPLAISGYKTRRRFRRFVALTFDSLAAPDRATAMSGRNNTLDFRCCGTVDRVSLTSVQSN